MSVENSPPRWTPSLEHMSKVKTIQLLWDSLRGKKVIKNMIIESFHGHNRQRNVSYHELLRYIVQQLIICLDQLILSPVMKNDLKSDMVHMVFKVLGWLQTITTDANRRHWRQPTTYLAEKMADFVDHFSWDNFGCVDGRKILESYVSDKETIDFVIWHQLCVYCIEDDIIKFAKTINWNECRQFNDSHYSIYWYWKIYGEFPARTMFECSDSQFQKDCDDGLYDDDNIIENMFKRSAVYTRYDRSNIPAMTYFQNLLRKDYEEFHQFVADTITPVITPEEGVIHLLRGINSDPLSPFYRALLNNCILEGLAQWPWNLFMDNWASVFENLDASALLLLIDNTLRIISYEDDESSRIKYPEADTAALYEFIKKLWTIFYRKFGSDNAILRASIWIGLKRLDIMYCQIMFDEVDIGQRDFFLQCMKDIVRMFSYRGSFRTERNIVSREFTEIIARRGFFRENYLAIEWI